jgi:hypothetical protein
MARAGRLVKRRADTLLSQVDRHPQGEEAGPDEDVRWLAMAEPATT